MLRTDFEFARVGILFLLLGVACQSCMAQFSLLAGNMVTPRAGHTATLLLNGKVLIAGGYGPVFAVSASAELFDPLTNTFSPTGNMTTARVGHAATLLLDGRVLIVGGSSNPSAEIFDPAKGRFTDAGNMVASPGPAALLHDGKVFIAGTPTAQLYDPVIGEFVATGPYADPAVGGIVSSTLLRDGRVLLIGGTATGGWTEIYDPVARTFSPADISNLWGEDRTVTLLPNGKVLFVGNFSNDGQPADAEIFDPADGKFTRIASAPSSHDIAAAALLADGTVLITGGQLPGGNGQVNCDLYSPASGTFSAAANMKIFRRSHTATTLDDGAVLIAGGFSIWSHPVVIPQSSAELYRGPQLTPPGSLHVNIDSPSANAVISGTVTISGWAIENANAIGSVLVKVDGALVGNASYGISRADVCVAYPGSPSCPGVGFTFQLDASSLTAGAHIITVSAADTYLFPQTDSASVNVTVAPAPTVHIDAPPPGSVLSGVATISGWAIDNTSVVGTAIAGVQVMVDGAPFGSATYGSPRLDVCAAFPGRPGCPNVGFTYSLDTSGLTPGSHVITVLATDKDSTPHTGSAAVAVVIVILPPAVYIDSLAPGAVLSGTVTVSGWAIDNAKAPGTAISKVAILVDGNLAGNATYGTQRIDVCNAFPGRLGCPNVGFTYPLDTTKLSPGAHTLTAVATDTDGTPDSGTWTVAFQVAQPTAPPPTVYIDSPPSGATVSGTVTVSGWAIDNTSTVGTAIDTVQVRVDGAVVANAAYGIPRTDVCNAFPGRLGCPNVGFTYQLNTASLSPGPHTLTVVATDKDATPDMGTFSIVVTVPAGAAPPSVVIDSPLAGSTVSGAVTISGWAIDSIAEAGGAIGNVQVLVDYQVVGSATYGVPRTDVCAVYTGRPGCPNVGFTHQLYTTSWTTGNHTITVLATGPGAVNDVGSASVVVKK